MIADAIDTVWTLGWALTVWIILLATVAGLIVYAVVIVAWTTARGVLRACRVLRARLRADLPPGGSQSAESPERRSQRPTPSWARTGHHDHDYKEAA